MGEKKTELMVKSRTDTVCNITRPDNVVSRMICELIVLNPNKLLGCLYLRGDDTTSCDCYHHSFHKITIHYVATARLIIALLHLLLSHNLRYYDYFFVYNRWPNCNIFKNIFTPHCCHAAKIVRTIDCYKCNQASLSGIIRSLYNRISPNL